MSAEIIQLTHKLTEAQFKAEKAKVATIHGKNYREAGAKQEQAMADLFIRSGWTQEELAKEEDKSQSWVARRLLFGRFLNFMPTGINAKTPAETLTEGAFRKLWEQTDKDQSEHIRFRAVLNLIQETITLSPPRRKRIGHEIVAEFADGEWHAPETIAKRIGAEVDHVVATLESLHDRISYGARTERRKVRSGIQFRIFRQEKLIGSQELITKLAPLVEALMVEGRKNAATASPPTVAYLAGSIKKLLDQWAE